MWTVYLF